MWRAILRPPTLASAFTVAAGAQAAAYAFSTLGRPEPTERYYDVSGTLTHLLIVGHAVGASAFSRGVVGGGARVLLLGTLSSAWAMRLGAYLNDRITRVGGDTRFDTLKRDPFVWPIPWAMQALWCTALQAPLVVAAGARLAPTRLTRWDAVGVAIFIGGLALETAADAQKDAAKRAAPHSPVTSGLFSLCVYPNYAGELALWWGAALLALPAAGGHPWAVAASLAAPVVTAALLLGVSGLPISEAAVWRRYGGDDAWLAYRARTPLLIPSLWGANTEPVDAGALAAARVRALAAGAQPAGPTGK